MLCLVVTFVTPHACVVGGIVAVACIFCSRVNSHCLKNCQLFTHLSQVPFFFFALKDNKLLKLIVNDNVPL